MHPKAVKIFFALFFIVFFIFISTPEAQAAIVPCGTSANPQECGICDIFQFGQNGINYLIFTFVPIVFTAVALYAGYLLLTSRGKPEAFSSATKILWNTALGVIIIFMAWLITTTILQSLAGDKNYAKEWYKIECTDPTISRSKLPGNGPGGSPFSCSADPTILGADKKSKFTVSSNSTITGDLNCTWPDPLDGSYEGGKPEGPCEATVVFGPQTISASLSVSVSDSASPPKTGNVLCKVSQTTSSDGSCSPNFGISASAGCPNLASCVDVSSYTPTHGCQSNNGKCLLSSGAATRVQKFVSTFNSLSGGRCSLKISSALQVNGGPSRSSCHKVGNSDSGICADFNVLPDYNSCKDVYYQAARDSGSVRSFLDEYVSACVASTTRGGNIHTNF